MLKSYYFLLTLSLASVLVVAKASAIQLVSPSSIHSPVTLLFQNNLNWTDDANHHSFLLLESGLSFENAQSACQALGENLLSSSAAKAQQSDLLPQLQYQLIAPKGGLRKIQLPKRLRMDGKQCICTRSQPVWRLKKHLHKNRTLEIR